MGPHNRFFILLLGTGSLFSSVKAWWWGLTFFCFESLFSLTNWTAALILAASRKQAKGDHEDEMIQIPYEKNKPGFFVGMDCNVTSRYVSRSKLTNEWARVEGHVYEMWKLSLSPHAGFVRTGSQLSSMTLKTSALMTTKDPKQVERLKKYWSSVLGT